MKFNTKYNMDTMFNDVNSMSTKISSGQCAVLTFWKVIKIFFPSEMKKKTTKQLVNKLK